jgi:putative inorganic carbon (hco3(-)) transporter
MVTPETEVAIPSTASKARITPGRLAFGSTITAPFAVATIVAALMVHAPLVALAGAGGIVFVGTLLLRVEWSVLAFVAIEPFEDYAKSLSGLAVKLLGALLFVAWLLRAVSASHPVRLRQPVVYAAATLVAVLLAAMVLHPNGSLGTEVAIRYFSYIGALIVLIDCMRGGLAPATVARVYVFACAAAALCGLIAYLGSSRLRVGGPVGDPNDFAFYLVAALPLAVALRQRSSRPWLYYLVVVVLLLAIAGTLSRGAFVGVAAMVVFVVATGRLHGPGAAVAFLLAVVGFVLVFALVPDRVSVSLSAKSDVATQNVDDRLVRWKVAGQMTADYPILGLGPAGFRENYNRYIDHRPLDPLHRLDVSHDTYLEVSSELGLTGLAAFAFVLAFGLQGARRRAREGGQDAGLAAAVCAAFGGTAVAAAFLTEQYFLPLWLLAALGAGLDPRAGPSAEDG